MGTDDTGISGFRRLGHEPALDGIRALAILVVVVHHTPALVPSWGPLLTRGGFLGVDAFFVLSGFLITALLLREQSAKGSVRFRSFYGRRAARLIPALAAMLLVNLIYVSITGLPVRPAVNQSASILLYFQNWYHLNGTTPGFEHVWSLGVEEQFYAVWPIILILVLGLRRRTSFVMAGTVAAIAVVVVHRASDYVPRNPFETLVLYSRVDYRADALLIGALVAQLWVRGLVPKRGLKAAAWIAAAGFAFCLVQVRVFDGFLYRGGYTLIAALVGVILLAALETDWSGNRFLSSRPLRTIGIVSYGLYLWHLPVFTAVYRYGKGLPSFVRLFVGLGLVALIVYASWVLIERPILRWKDRKLSPGRSAETVSSTEPVTSPKPGLATMGDAL